MMPPIIHEDAVKGIRLLLLDVDGVLTDGRLLYGSDGAEMKAFHARDGMGIALLHRAGIETGIISGRDDTSVRRRAEELGMSIIALGEQSKGSAVKKILADRGLAPGAVAFVGDDVNDLPALAEVGVPIAVADAHPDVLSFARYITRSRGGEGAVREVADAILGLGAIRDDEGEEP